LIDHWVTERVSGPKKPLREPAIPGGFPVNCVVIVEMQAG